MVNNEQPQERSGISKSTKENDQATLSFEIPPDTLKTLLQSVHLPAPSTATAENFTTVENSTQVTNTEKNDTIPIDQQSTNGAQPKLIDLSKLLTPSNELAIKSTETADSNDSSGHKETATDNSNTNKTSSISKEEKDSSKSEEKAPTVGGSSTNEDDFPKNNPSMISVDKEALLAKLATLLKNGKTEVSNNEETNASNGSSSVSTTADSTHQPTGIFDDINIGGGGGIHKGNQIALVPVSIPSQLSTTLQIPSSKTANNNTSNNSLSINELRPVSSDSGNLNQPYDSKHTKNPSDDSKLYTPPENSTTIKSPMISREELLKHLKDSLLSKSTSSKTANADTSSVKSEKVDEKNKNSTSTKTNEKGVNNLLVSKLLSVLTESTQNHITQNQSQHVNSTTTTQNTDEKTKKLNNKPDDKNETTNTDINAEITSGLKKLLGLYNITNPTVAREKDGEKFIQTIESCKRFNENDPNCLYGKTITESNGVPLQSKQPGSVLDESKQTISISPSSLMQKLMERKKAEESTPDAVVNNVESVLKPGKTVGNEPNTATRSQDTSKELTSNDLDPNTLLTLLSAALGKSSTKTIPSSKRDGSNDVTTPIEMVPRTSHLEQNNTWNFAGNCSKLFKRGLTINFDCNNLLSNKTHFSLKGQSPELSTVDFVHKLLETDDLARHSVPAARVQKTANGFQVNFDLHVKDQIPTQVSGTLKTLSSGRQQHVNIFNTPEGVFMKPKSSVQLLRPSFVPVKQSHDNMELRKVEASPEKRFHIGK